MNLRVIRFLAPLAGAVLLMACSKAPTWRGQDVSGVMPDLAFELTDSSGKRVRTESRLGQATLLYFGFTNCPDICPTTLMTLTAIQDQLAVEGNAADHLQILFVTVDPERDTPEVIGEFVKFHHPKMIGLTGSKDQIQNVSKSYKTYYKAQKTNDDLYLVDHSTLTYLILPEYGFVEFFRRDKSAEEIAEITACFIGNS